MSSNYFHRFPITSYEFNGKSSIVKDIFRRAAFVSEYRPYSDLYETFLIKDGDTPQSIQIKFYGDVGYHWLILMFNEIHDVNMDWPMSQLTLEQYCRSKYGTTGMFMVSHYEIDGNVVGEVIDFVSEETWVSPTNPYPDRIDCIPMTFFDKENTRNDSKRQLKLLRPELMLEFISQFNGAING